MTEQKCNQKDRGYCNVIVKRVREFSDRGDFTEASRLLGLVEKEFEEATTPIKQP